jgi:anti-sigma28 factor (negative regulator of flagellin synthesis)
VAATTAPAIPAEQALRARAAYAALPDIRLDKVREVRRRMAAGKFNPSAGDLADAILAFADNTRRCR